MSKLGILATAICVCTALPLVVRAQEHTGHSESSAGDGIPVSAGQAAYAAISEIVRILKSDPNTDWAKVDIGALRQHLVEMDDATMRAVTTERNVPAGIEIDIDGAGPAGAAATRMATTHMRILEQGSEYRASSAAVPGGVRITITARDPRNAQVVDRIRGLGFAGIMTEGEHHARHHIALARGDTGRYGTH
jgi:hypothetical protein